jgi:peroxiredoxin
MKPFLFAIGLSLGAALPIAALAAPKVGQTAPQFRLPTVDRKTLSLSSLRGRAVYLNFFATWCPPCNEEAPVIGKLSDRYRARGLMVVGVDELEDTQKAKEFLANYHLGYTAVIDTDGKAGQAYGAIGLPVHIFINRAGIVSTYRLGEMNPAEMESAIQAILRQS